MSDYQGLNLPELLDLLEPIVLPEPVSLLPATPGWWMIGGWLAALALIAIGHGWRAWQANRYRREARAEIDALMMRTEDSAAHAAAIATIVKRTALAAYPRADVASLTGADWAAFLKRTSREDPHVTAAAEPLASAAYRSDIDPAELLEPARRWITLHRV